MQEQPVGEPIWEVVATYLRDRKVIRAERPDLPRLEGVAGNAGLKGLFTAGFARAFANVRLMRPLDTVRSCGELAQTRDAPHVREAGLLQIVRQELLVQSDLVLVVLVEVATEHHQHHAEALVSIEPFAINEERRENVEVRNADEQYPTGPQNALPLAQTGLELSARRQMLENVRSVDHFERVVGEPREPVCAPDMVDVIAREHVQDLPARRAECSPMCSRRPVEATPGPSAALRAVSGLASQLFSRRRSTVGGVRRARPWSRRDFSTWA